MRHIQWAGSDAPGLDVRGLEIWRGGRPLLTGINLSLTRGSLALITGPNGSGKTSFLRCLVGFLSPEKGEVSWPLRSPEEIAWEGHALGLKGELSVVDNLTFFKRLNPAATSSDLETFGLRGLEGRLVSTLSAGQRRRVGLARLQASGRPVWVLDEPYTNLDQAGRDLVNEMVRSRLEQGGLALIAAHQPPAFPGIRVQSVALADSG